MSQLKSGTVGIQNFRERERETAASLRDGGEAPPRSETPPDILLFFNNTHTHILCVEHITYNIPQNFKLHQCVSIWSEDPPAPPRPKSPPQGPQQIEK